MSRYNRLGRAMTFTINPKAQAWPCLGFNIPILTAMALLLILSVQPLLAASGPNFQNSNSQYYRVHSTAPLAETNYLKQYMDLLFETYQQRFSEFRRRDSSPMDFYLFASRPEYQDFLAQQNLGAASTSGGVFFVNGKMKGLATYIEERDPEWTLHTLRHEGFHQFAYAYIGPNLALWVNEGLAEYFAEGIVLHGRILPGIVPGRRLAAVRTAIATHTTIDFPHLISMGSEEWQRLMEERPDHGGLLYNQSWSMVHFLIHADHGKYAPAFTQYLKYLAADMPSKDAFAKAFGGNDPDQFRNRWVEYVASLKPDALSEALDDLRFQAMGLRLIFEQKAPIPHSAHQLKKMLQQGNFYIVEQGHGQNYRLEASDDQLFSYNLPNGKAMPFVMLEPSRNDLPPRLTAPGLHPEPTVNWTRNHDGKLVFRVDFR
jgi:hypothetical protein